mmetsp:Transcript_3765/g.13348  ORF Transcript_3765/g.13348 Transcript_3765/m.13348 type:complete len:430 (-) Transcript_3765:50-1339(-)
MIGRPREGATGRGLRALMGDVSSDGGDRPCGAAVDGAEPRPGDPGGVVYASLLLAAAPEGGFGGKGSAGIRVGGAGGRPIAAAALATTVAATARTTSVPSSPPGPSWMTLKVDGSPSATIPADAGIESTGVDDGPAGRPDTRRSPRLIGVTYAASISRAVIEAPPAAPASPARSGASVTCMLRYMASNNSSPPAPATASRNPSLTKIVGSNSHSDFCCDPLKDGDDEEEGIEESSLVAVLRSSATVSSANRSASAVGKASDPEMLAWQASTAGTAPEAAPLTNTSTAPFPSSTPNRCAAPGAASSLRRSSVSAGAGTASGEPGAGGSEVARGASASKSGWRRSLKCAKRARQPSARQSRSAWRSRSTTSSSGAQPGSVGARVTQSDARGVSPPRARSRRTHSSGCRRCSRSHPSSLITAGASPPLKNAR